MQRVTRRPLFEYGDSKRKINVLVFCGIWKPNDKGQNRCPGYPYAAICTDEAGSSAVVEAQMQLEGS